LTINKFSDDVINKYKPLVKSIARKYINSGELLEDLEQIGYLGLLNALQLFDEKKGVKFATYATWLINGEIRHYIRDKYSVIKIPHWVRDFNRKIDKFVEKYRKDKDRFPTIDEISEQFNITELGIVEILKGRKAVQVVSLDKEMRKSEGDNTPIIENIKSKEYRTFQLPVEDVIHLKNTMNTLKKIHKQVIYYLFYKDLTQINVAKKLGLTQRQVSRIKQEAINELRKNF
jgi:RNA polymerase sigma factor (sigma-70 family)